MATTVCRWRHTQSQGRDRRARRLAIAFWKFLVDGLVPKGGSDKGLEVIELAERAGARLPNIREKEAKRKEEWR